MTVQPNTPALRSEIEKALNEIISNEEGMRFQGLAVVLAKQQCSDLVASERKNDWGLDAHARGATSLDKMGKGLACSITAELSKIIDDATKAKAHFDDISVLYFATPQKVSNPKKAEWAQKIRTDFGYELVVLSREDIISSLMEPKNAPLCGSFLAIDLEVDQSISDLVDRIKDAAKAEAETWKARTPGPLIGLLATSPDDTDADSSRTFDLPALHEALHECNRLILEGPAGRGKTTTLAQLAELHMTLGAVAFVIDLPLWVSSGSSVLDFIAQSPEFLARGADAAALAKAQHSTHYSFLLNGWNEVTVSDSRRAADQLRTLDRLFPAAGIIIATRTHHIRPPLAGARRLALLRLTRRQRNEYLRQRLGTRATELTMQLDADKGLDDLTRTPLVLSGVVDIFAAGAVIPKTKMGVLQAVVGLIEQAPEHSAHLASSPLDGLQSFYLEELALALTATGAVTIVDTAARGVVHGVAQRLHGTHQIQTLPDQAAVLNALCAHHVLERVTHPGISYRFSHQQFQELYAAAEVKRQLLWVASDNRANKRHDFTATYVNATAWAEPLRMIAETIGTQVDNVTANQTEVQAGRALVEMAADVDLIFAGELAGRSGPLVWRDAGPALGARLRSWHVVQNKSHRNCALAAMLATGSDDFKDVLLPLLSSSDQQVRHAIYRLWEEFHLSSLGTDWRHELASWPEDVRADFVRDALYHQIDPDLVAFAVKDKSPKVKQAAASELSWRVSDDALTQVLESMDSHTFDTVAIGNSGERVPKSFRPRVLDSLRRAYEASSNQSARLRLLMHMAELDESDLDGRIKECLDATPTKELHDLSHLVRSALDVLRKGEQHWVSEWVARHVAGQSLWSPQYWMPYVSSMPADLVEKHLQRIEAEHVSYRRIEGLASLLTAHANVTLAATLFVKIRDLRRLIDTKPADTWEQERERLRQFETLFRAVPGDIAAAAMLSVVSDPKNLSDLDLTANLVSRALRHNEVSFDVSDESLRERLRAFLKAGVTVVLSEDGSGREPLAQLAAAIVEVGKPQDMTDLVTLVRADIERGKAARSAMSYSNYYVPAIMRLDPRQGEKVLIELLGEPEYTRVVAEEMSRPFLARPAGAFDRAKQYDSLWAARQRKSTPPADNEQRLRYAAALREQIVRLTEERAHAKVPGPITYRSKELAQELAAIDPQGSADVVLAAVTLPSQSDDWRRVETAERLLLGGVILPTDITLGIVDGATQTMKNYGSQNGHNWTLKRALCLCPFVDAPADGIVKIREVLATELLAPYELRDLVVALGESRCSDAVDLLRDVASSPDAFKEFADTWPRAVAKVGTYAARGLLLSFVDPDLSGLATEPRIEQDDTLVWCIAEVAKEDTNVMARLRELSERDLSPLKRHLLARVLSRIQTPEALFANLNLIDDHLPWPIPRGTWEHVERAFVQRRPSDQMENAFTLESSVSNDLRAKLFEMATHDSRRRRAAFDLIGHIEEWRLEHGRPTGEPRHPAFGSTDPWPPLEPSAPSTT